MPQEKPSKIDRGIERLALVREQIVEVERERDLAPTPCAAAPIWVLTCRTLPMPPH